MKINVKYPESGVTVTKYVTTDKGATQETSGRTSHLPGSRYFIRPSLNKTLIRKAGVTRTSNKVRAVNAKLEAVKDTVNAPAVKCGGKKWPEFVSCLKKQMKETLKDYTKEEATEMTAEDFEKKY